MKRVRLRYRLGLHRARRTVIKDEFEKLGASIVTDRIHHPLALHDESHIEIGGENSLALGERRHHVGAFR
jgi:hypothetical protein